LLTVLSGHDAWAQAAATGSAATPAAAPASRPVPAVRRPPLNPPPMATPMPVGPRTLQESLAAAYANNPTLQAARAKLRAVDEGVPQALSGWRPTVILSGTGGITDATSWARGARSGPDSRREIVANSASRQTGTGQATVTQQLYSGGRTRASTNAAENKVMAERARLISSEQQVFTDTISAFVGVIQATQILALTINNEQVLARQLQATQDRFRVGEITRTDVAQAEAALATATAQRQTSEGNLAVARANYARMVGAQPGDLIPPQPLALPVKTVQEAAIMAASNNPTVVAALFDDASAKDAVDVAFSALMPQFSVQAQGFTQNNSQLPHTATTGGQVVASLSVPIYQGGAEHSAVRQARQTQQQTRKLVDDARRAAVQQASQAWATLDSARATVASTREAIRANRIALEGVTREALVGSRTTLDVLNAQQAVLNTEVTLVQNLASLVIASHNVAAAIGRLTARDMNVAVPLYDETAYYNAVRDRWAGTGDYATGQPGR
jgi:outer membrane protein